MFGLGIPELIVIFVLALLIFGPKKLPDLGKSIGRAMAEFKKASDDFQESVKAEMKEVEKSSGIDEVKKLGDISLPDIYPGGTPKAVPDEVVVEEKQEARAGDQPKSGEASNG